MFKQMTKKEIIFFVSSILLMIVQVWLELKIPGYMSDITKLVTTGGETSEVINIGIIMILCALGGFFISVIIGFFSSFVGTSFEKNLRSKIYRKVQGFGMEEINKFSTSSLITRNTNDVTQVKNFVVMGTQMLARAPIMASMAIFKILGKEWQFSVATGVGVLLIFVMVSIIVIFAIPKFKIFQKLTDNLNRITRENLTGIKVVRAFNAEKYQQNKFHIANNELTRTNLFIGRIMTLMDPMMTIVMSGLPLAIYWIGSSLMNSVGITERIVLFSDMVVFSSYGMQVILSFTFLVMIFVIYPRAAVSMGRISEILDTKERIKDGTIDTDTTEIKGVIEFKNVSFKYPDADECVLENINFKVNSGETVAFIGSTGSGKSTLINLVPRFYDVTDGEILIDGVNIKDMTEEYLHNKIGYVSQKAILFKGTVKSNIDFGKSDNKITEDVAKKALNVAQGNFVFNMDKGINSHIAQSGTNVSGGQKQRISIARAVARDPEIYIFDDAFSALDFKTDYKLRKELNKISKNATKLIVASRIGTIMEADKIVVLENGKCVGIGKHNELLKTCKVYKEIASSQFGEEELDHA
jgi:ATP-binding cassette subfamily B protein